MKKYIVIIKVSDENKVMKFPSRSRFRTFSVQRNKIRTNKVISNGPKRVSASMMLFKYVRRTSQAWLSPTLCTILSVLKFFMVYITIRLNKYRLVDHEATNRL